MIESSIVILAGGSSSRLGVSKQLIQYHGRSLLQYACEIATGISEYVVVITGANHHSILPQLEGVNVQVVQNKEWNKGIGHSMALAIKHEFNTHRCLFMNCDQPFIPSAHYRQLLEKSVENPGHLIVTEVNDAFMMPAVVPKELFYEVSTMKPEQTPESFIQDHLSQARSITCEQAAFSVDTPEDIGRLKTEG